MVSTARNLKGLGLCLALVLLAGAVSCTGFFRNPTLITLTVGPTTPSILEGSTKQMTATGTFDDNTTQTLTSNVDWSSDATDVATVSDSGLVKGITAGTATITAQSGTVSGSTTVTVTLANLTSITVNPSTGSVSGSGITKQYTATGHFSGASDQDITTQVTWSVDPSTAATISNSAPTQGQLTTSAVTSTTTVTVTATSGNVSGSATLTVSP